MSEVNIEHMKAALEISVACTRLRALQMSDLNGLATGYAAEIVEQEVISALRMLTTPTELEAIEVLTKATVHPVNVEAINAQWVMNGYLERVHEAQNGP